MAKYEITHACGHQQTHQIYGPNTRGQREHRARQIGDQPCDECKAAGRDWASAQAVEAAEAAGWLPLTGSERQVAWAQALRADAMAQIAEWAYQWGARALDAHWTAEQADALAGLLINAWQGVALRQTSARWWIDTRGRLDDAIVAALVDDDGAAYREGVRGIVATLSAEAAVWTAPEPTDTTG